MLNGPKDELPKQKPDHELMEEALRNEVRKRAQDFSLEIYVYDEVQKVSSKLNTLTSMVLSSDDVLIDEHVKDEILDNVRSAARDYNEFSSFYRTTLAAVKGGESIDITLDELTKRLYVTNSIAGYYKALAQFFEGIFSDRSAIRDEALQVISDFRDELALLSDELENSDPVLNQERQVTERLRSKILKPEDKDIINN